MKRTECVESGAGRVADHDPGGEVDDVRAVLLHLRRRVLHVAAGTSAAGRVADQFDFLAPVAGKGALAMRRARRHLPPAQVWYRSQMMMPSFFMPLASGYS